MAVKALWGTYVYARALSLFACFALFSPIIFSVHWLVSTILHGKIDMLKICVYTTLVAVIKHIKQKIKQIMKQRREPINIPSKHYGAT